MEELLRPFVGLVQVAWVADDPDADKLRAQIEVLDIATSRRLLIAEEFEGDAYLVNTNNLPDGKYLAVVTLTDAIDNDPGNDRVATRQSDVFLVDNVPPILKVDATRNADASVKLTGSVRDESGRVSAIWYYDEDGKWQRLPPTDGIADQQEEMFSVTRPANATPRAIVFKAIDQNGNVGYARVSF
jgi:hypothetical protein